MSLFKRLLGEAGPSQADLQRQADDEIKQMLSQSSPAPADLGRNDMSMQAPSDKPEEQAAK
jgi:hypothetical protein